MTAPDRPTGPARWPVTRRTFLQLAGISAAGLAVSGTAIAQSPEPVTTQAPSTTEPDPVTALAGQLEFDLERIFRFVADEIAYEPYPGVLRGAKGALRGRAANSADKAVLLASLLEVSQIPYRYVRGTLDDTTAAAVLAASQLDQVGARQLAEASLRFRSSDQPSLFAPAPTPSPSAPPDADQILGDVRSEAGSLMDLAGRQVDLATSTIMDALGAAGITLASGAALPAFEREQHLWVQANSGLDWIDMDATLAGARQGSPLGTVVGDPMDSIPDELRHRVELVVIAETVGGGQLVESEIHRQTAWADEIAGAPMLFFNARAGDLAAIGVSLAGAIEGSTSYYPAIVIGSDSQSGETPLVLSSGDGLFEVEGSIEGEATAEWLELHISSPGSSPITARRTIFDRVGAEQRAAGTFDPAALPAVELVEIGGDGPEYLPALAIHALAVATGPISGDAFQTAAAAGQSDFSMIARCYHYIRDAINSELGLARGVRVIADGPTVASFTLQPGPAGGSGPTVLTSIDVLHRSLTTLPLADVAPSAEPGVVAGVLSHVAERMATGDGLPLRGRPARPKVSVGAIFDIARASGVPTRVLRGPEMPADLALQPEAAALLSVAFDAGLVVVIPASPVDIGGEARIGWWLVDPATGRTIDQLDDGRGAVLPEYAKLQAMAARWGPVFFVVGQCVAKYGTLLSMLITAASGSEAAGIAAETAQAASESGLGELC